METIVFDLNGTLVDSERAHWLAYNDVLQKYSIDFGFAEFSEDWTRRGQGLSFTLSKHGRSDLLPFVDDLKGQKDLIFRSKIAERLSLMPGVAEILPKLILDFVLAVDSTSTKEDITKILDHFELTPYFRIIGASDMPWDSKRYGKNSKSSRLKYIANQLRCDTKQCIMVGDAEKDIIAAKDNNMPVIIIPTETTKDNDLSSADLILSSFIELSCEVVRNVLKRIA